MIFPHTKRKQIKWLHNNCVIYTWYPNHVANFTDKNILNRALEDGGFWHENSALKQREKVVWLLLYDMQGRKFARRRDGNALEIRNRIFKVYSFFSAITLVPFSSLKAQSTLAI